MKKIIGYILSVGIVMGVLAGCGGEYAGVSEGSAVSGGAVSGGAVSGSAVSGKLTDSDVASGSAVKKQGDMSSHRFCTDTNLYYTENGSIMQMRLDGTNKTCVEKQTDDDIFVSLNYVDGSCLYYELWTEEHKKDVVYCVPIGKGLDGYDEVKMSEKEEILTGRALYVIYADTRYLFYSTGDDEIIKYDLQKQMGKETSSDVSWTRDFSIFRIEEGYLAVSMGEEIFLQDEDSVQWKKISDAVIEGIPYFEENMTQNEKAVFYPQYLDDYEEDVRFCIQRCDGKREADFISWEQLSQTIMREKKVNELDICMVRWMFWQDGRLYIQIQVGWMKKGTYHMEYVILSQEEKKDGTGAGLRYEKKLTESMQSHANTRIGKWADADDEEDIEEGYGVMLEHMTSNDAQCIAMTNGRAYLSCYDYEAESGRLAYYELDSGKFQWVDREDTAFYELGYDGVVQEFEVVFNERYADDERDKNKYTNFYWDPSVDTCGAGYLWEEERYDGNKK